MDLWAFLTSSHDQVIAIANFFIAVGTIVLAIGIPYAIKGAGRQQRDTFYATLDRTYFEIQKLLIEHPHLWETDCTAKTKEQVIQFDAFAFIVWNFIESIYDYSTNENKLGETWKCILQYESKKYRTWFKDKKNQKKFKGPFVKYIEHGGFLNDPVHGED